MIGRAGVGVDNVDVAAASKAGILVANAPQSTVISAAEHTIGLLLALTRQIPQAHGALKESRWERSRFGGIELADKTLGLVGFGRIGQQVARRARGFEMRVLAHDPYVAPERFRELGAERADSLQALFAEADFVSLHATLTADTRGLIGAEEIAQMRDGVRIVNVARGELIDEDALVEGLKSGKVAGAAIDVFAEEPYSGGLLALDNVVVTPHLAASTEEAQDRAGLIVAEQVAAALEGGLVTNAVNVPGVSAEDLAVLGPFLPWPPSSGRWRSSSPGATRRGSTSPTSASWPSATRASSRWPRSTAPFRVASRSRSTTSTRRSWRMSAGSRSARSAGVARLPEPRGGDRSRRRRGVQRRRHGHGLWSTSLASCAPSATRWRSRSSR